MNVINNITYNTVVRDALERFSKKLSKRLPLKDVHLWIHTDKNKVGEVKLFHIALHVDSATGEKYIAQIESHSLLIGVRLAIKKIMHQTYRTDRQKHEEIGAHRHTFKIHHHFPGKELTVGDVI